MVPGFLTNLNQTLLGKHPSRPTVTLNSQSHWKSMSGDFTHEVITSVGIVDDV